MDYIWEHNRNARTGEMQRIDMNLLHLTGHEVKGNFQTLKTLVVMASGENQKMNPSNLNGKIMKLLNLLFFAFCITLLSCNSDSKDNIVVLVKYKTQINKNVDAEVALKELIGKVKKEKHFKKINMYVDPSDNSNILLYEEWDDENYYKTEHMETTHLQKFITDSRTFLAGPPEISFWTLNSSYK